MDNVELIVFDLGYTLACNAREKQYRQYIYEKGVHISEKEIDLAFHLADKMFMRDYPGVLGSPPQYHLPWYLGVVNYMLENQFDLLEQTEHFMNQAAESNFWKLFPWTESVLDSLKNAG